MTREGRADPSIRGLTRRPPAPSRRSMTTKERREFYAEHCGDNEYPICNICGFWVIGKKWAKSHIPVPHAWNGVEVGVAHKRCNDEYWAKVESKMLAKARRRYEKDRDIHVARRPMPGGKNDPRKRTIGGRIVARATGAPWKETTMFSAPKVTTYRGRRDGGGVAKVQKRCDGKWRALRVRRDLANHSPEGFEWGYGGSGPAQLALALLADATGDDRRALAWHQPFKFAVVAKLARVGFSLSDRQVLDGLAELEKETAGEPS